MSVCSVHTSLWGNCHVKYILKFSLHTQPAQPSLSWHCKTLLPSFYPIGRLRVMCGWACASTLGAKKISLRASATSAPYPSHCPPHCPSLKQLGSAGRRLVTPPRPHPKFISYDTYIHTVTLHCALWGPLYSLPSRNHKSMPAYVTVSVKDNSIRKPLTDPFHQSVG